VDNQDKIGFSSGVVDWGNKASLFSPITFLKKCFERGIMMKKMRSRRCELSTPASNPHMIKKALQSEADYVFLDLEDSVAPNEKDKARQNVIEAFNGFDWGKKTRGVRINSIDTKWAYRDIIEIVKGAKENLDVIIIPKITGAKEVQFVDMLLDQVEEELNMTKRIALECLIETAEALDNISTVVRASDRLEAVIFGSGDFSASIGIPHNLAAMSSGNSYPGHRWHYALGRILTAARPAGLQVIDGPFPSYKDLDGYRQEAVWDLQLGIDGKWAIHPSQISICNEVFTPSEEIVKNAKRVIEEYRHAMEKGLGAITIDGDMVDAASVKIAERILSRAGVDT
jgi:citrate lyase subunit beta/citryl-CoA lyase